MTAERNEFGVARIVCACRACVANCRFVPGALIPADLQRIAEYLDEFDLTRFAFDNLLASPGAIIYTRSGLIRIRTLVPARRADGACKFLTCDLKQKMASGGSKRWRASYHESTTYETHPKPGWKH
jgi:hypothetical protein